MKFPVDYHMHTLFSDGRDYHESYIFNALQRGFVEIGFSDHISVKPGHWATDPARIALMKQKVESLQEACKGLIDIKFGIEMDYFENFEEDIFKIIETLKPDYVIGSVHFIGDWNFDTDLSLYPLWEPEKLFSEYYRLLGNAASTGLFQIIGHFDLVKKFNPGFPPKVEDFENIALEAIKKAGIAIELNTGGKRKPCAEFYPSASVLERCFKMGIPLTMGSDAHCAADQGQFFNEGIQLVKNVGFEYLQGYLNQKSYPVKI